MPVPAQYPVLMPETPSEIVAEIGSAPSMRAFKEELITGARFQQEFAILRQQRINEANRTIEHRLMEGLGQKIGEIDQELYFQMMHVYGRECWNDPEFVEDTLRKNPWMRIHTRFPARILVDGFRRSSDIEDGAAGKIEPGCNTPQGDNLPGDPGTPLPRFGPLNSPAAPLRDHPYGPEAASPAALSGPEANKIVPFAA